MVSVKHGTYLTVKSMERLCKKFFNAHSAMVV